MDGEQDIQAPAAFGFFAEQSLLYQPPFSPSLSLLQTKHWVSFLHAALFHASASSLLALGSRQLRYILHTLKFISISSSIPPLSPLGKHCFALFSLHKMSIVVRRTDRTHCGIFRTVTVTVAGGDS